MSALAQALSAALLHFVWQGALVGLLLLTALVRIRGARLSGGMEGTILTGSPPQGELPQFEVASIRRNTTGATGIDGSGRISIQTSPDTLTMRNVTVMSCLRWAYDLHDYQISGPPSLGVERYDITAKAAGPAPDGQLKLILRTLLAERFQLAAHNETKDLPVYMLTVDKGGPKLRASTGAGAGTMKATKLRAEFQHTSMPELAGFLAGPMLMPVVDATGVGGAYDFVLDMTGFIGVAGDSGPTKAGIDMPGLVISAAQEQLGLQLKPGKAPVEFLMVDRVTKPTED